MYVDEVGIDNDITPSYGWSQKGTKSHAEKIAFRAKRLSMVAAYRYTDKTMLAPFECEGYTDQYLFSSWFENMLCPFLHKGDTVIMDNASFHNKYELIEIANDYGIKMVFLPAYSPDLNPIEKCWANFKRWLRKLIKKSKTFQDAITSAFNEAFSG